MVLATIEKEINDYKSQLGEFLSSRYVDQSLILGFTTVVQGKFETWVLEDAQAYHDIFQDTRHFKQIDAQEFCLIELLQALWNGFHHPIIKSFQQQHAELCRILMHSMKEKKLSLKIVEIRKVNESLEKFVRSAKKFYTSILQKIGSKYPNLLIPQKFLEEFGIIIPSGTDDSISTDLDSNLCYAMFLCLLYLGNLGRHRAHIRLNYVEPFQSTAAFYKQRKLMSEDTQHKKSAYIYPLLCYSKCTGLLPTMNEPYNHIGVIYNALGQKFNAALWFLRSQCTRDVNKSIGRYNLATIFTKPWLEKEYATCIKKAPEHLVTDDANTLLLRIIGDYFYPNAYRNRLYIEKVQSDLVNILFLEPKSFRLIEDTNVVNTHLTFLFCIYSLAQQEKSPVFVKRIGSFIVHYVTEYLTTVESSAVGSRSIEMALKNLRLILAFYRKNSELLMIKSDVVAENLADALTALLAFDDDESKTRVMSSFATGETPVRTHYFSEDIQFKDFTSIGCQFKDFNDNHLFQSGNLHLLFGSYFYRVEKEVPSFLDNEVVARINKEAELATGEEAKADAIQAECSRYENILRLQAIASSTKQLLGHKIALDEERECFTLVKVDVSATQPKATGKKPKQKKRSTPAPETQASAPESSISSIVPSSIEEIELMILGHGQKVSSDAANKNPLGTVSADNGSKDQPAAVTAPDAIKPMLLKRPQRATNETSGQAAPQAETPLQVMPSTAQPAHPVLQAYGQANQPMAPNGWVPYYGYGSLNQYGMYMPAVSPGYGAPTFAYPMMPTQNPYPSTSNYGATSGPESGNSYSSEHPHNGHQGYNMYPQYQ